MLNTSCFRFDSFDCQNLSLIPLSGRLRMHEFLGTRTTLLISPTRQYGYPLPVQIPRHITDPRNSTTPSDPLENLTTDAIGEYIDNGLRNFFFLVFSLPPPVGKIHNLSKIEMPLIDSFHIMSS